MSFLRTTIATLTGIAFQRGVGVSPPGAFDASAFDEDAFDTFDGGAITERGPSVVTGAGLTFTRTTELN